MAMLTIAGTAIDGVNHGRRLAVVDGGTDRVSARSSCRKAYGVVEPRLWDWIVPHDLTIAPADKVDNPRTLMVPACATRTCHFCIES